MPTPPRHFKEEIQDWLDQRLDAATCDEVERHLETCAECRRVFDLGMMNYSLVGGRVEQLGRRARASFIYRGQGNQILLCQMYAGKVAELPSGAVQRENKGIKFYIYHSNGLTRVFWQEGSVVCVLISDIESEQVIQLAFAKAMTI